MTNEHESIATMTAAEKAAREKRLKDLAKWASVYKAAHGGFNNTYERNRLMNGR